jgi:hypothetical protein
MTGVAAGLLALQGLGAVFALAGVVIGHGAAARAGLFRPMAEIESLAAALNGEPMLVNGARLDAVKEWWTLLGAVLAVLAGAAMLAVSQAAPILLSLILLHHILYFARQEDASAGRGARVGHEVSRRMALGFGAVAFCAAAAALLGALGGLR